MLSKDKLDALSNVLTQMCEFRDNIIANDDESHNFYKNQVDEIEKIVFGVND